MGDLSRDFSRSEFECKCGCGFFKENPLLIATLQKIRDYANRKSLNETDIPMFVNSGCRCVKHNASVGGVKSSRHLTGEAADVRIPGWESERLLNLIKRMALEDRIYVGYAYKIDDTSVHIDVRIPQSATVRRWFPSSPKT
jgi:uncharacterized protein YcbK (DUF882 family)